jgi:hypothetical protein
MASRFFLPLVFLFAAQANAQEKLLPENIMAIQEALVWAGDYDGPLDGSLGRATLTALKQFQAREGAPVKGRINAADIKKLAAVSETAKRDAGWTLTLDGGNDVVLWLPRALLPNDTADEAGRTFTSADGRLRLALTAFDRSPAEFHAQALKKPARTIWRESLDKTRALVTGMDGDRGFFEFAEDAKSGVKGFAFSYPAEDAGRLRAAATAIANGFIAEPGAPLAKKAARAVPDFIGALRFENAERPYPYGMIDVETRDVVIVGGDIAVSLVATEPPPPPDEKPQKRKRRRDFDAPFVPKLQIFVAGELAFETRDPEAVTHFTDARIIELDPGNAQPEIMLTYYTGGAHCCTELKIFSQRTDGSWATIDGGSFDGAPDFPHDLDGDGRYELVNADNAFLGAFDCYACSYAPDEIREVKGETVVDVSADEKFRAYHRAQLGEMWNWGWQNAALSEKGFLAGFVAAGRRAGQGDDVWAFLETHYKAEKGDGEPFADRLRAFLESENY